MMTRSRSYTSGEPTLLGQSRMPGDPERGERPTHDLAGKSQRICTEHLTSEMPSITDMRRTFRKVRVVPLSDSCVASKRVPSFDHLVGSDQERLRNDQP